MTRVAPHAGAWIEILLLFVLPSLQAVAPHAGAWIEIDAVAVFVAVSVVAPHAGAWIEMLKYWPSNTFQSRRTPCGCVD